MFVEFGSISQKTLSRCAFTAQANTSEVCSVCRTCFCCVSWRQAFLCVVWCVLVWSPRGAFVFVCVNLSKGYAFRTSSKHSYYTASCTKLSFGWGLGERVGLQKLWGRMPRPLALAMTCLLIMPRTSDRYGVAWLGSAGLGSAGLGKPGLGWARLGFARLGWVVLGCAGLP